jgi:DNA mismatch endonuclease, patch repair protein
VADVYSRIKRSKIMAGIRGRDTSPEIELIRLLKQLGFAPQRYRKDLPGSPDAVLPRNKTVLFVNGCFWHGHQNCRRATIPSSNTKFWRGKIETNMRRDAAQRRKLREMGWSVLTFWTCKPLTQSSLIHRLRRYADLNMRVTRQYQTANAKA